MIKIRTAILAATAAALTALPVRAVTTGPQDMDGDGFYSWKELAAVWPDLDKKALTAADSDGDGALSLAELTAAQETGLIPA